MKWKAIFPRFKNYFEIDMRSYETIHEKVGGQFSILQVKHDDIKTF